MGKKPETLFKEKVIRDLRSLGNAFVAKIQQRALKGTPDLLCCVNGIFVAIELKRGEGVEIAPLQRWQLDEIVNANGMGFTAYPENWDAVFNYLKKISGAVYPPPPEMSKERMS